MDYAKITKGSSAGVPGKLRLLIEFAIAGIATYWIMQILGAESGEQVGKLAIPVPERTHLSISVGSISPLLWW